MKKSILVPFDGSKNAIEALKFAISLTQQIDGAIVLLNVQLNINTLHTKLFFDEQTIRQYTDKLFAEAVESAGTILAASGLEHQVKLRLGDAREQICQEAADSGVYMIVMGSRGMNPVMGILGSVSQGVVNGASCPVAIVPPAR